MSTWYFRPKQPGETIREPIHGEFFASDAISDPGMALVREGIQNALDAGTGSGRVLVRIFLSGMDNAISPADIAPFLGSGWDHWNARDNGLHPDGVPAPDAPCRFLVFEDFGTCGLEGDPGEAFRSREGCKNHFYHFFRAEGQSDKGETDRGSWGVGKHVFLRSSRVSTIFALTVRADDHKPMLMGKTVLKSHWVQEQYCQDGYYGVPPSDGQPLVLPVTESALLERFGSLFDLGRRSEPGLSLVVPWPDEEITDRTIITAVLRDYFYPILTRQLEVIVETPSIKTVLDADSLLTEVDKLDARLAGELKPLMELADWACSIRAEERITLQSPNRTSAWQWSDTLFTPDQLSAIRASYYGGQRLAVRVPVTVRHRDGSLCDSHFDIYLMRDGSEEAGRPTYIREGIIVSRVDAPRTRGVRAVVVAEQGPLAAFLRDAENPSHTEWQHARLKEKYKIGSKTDLDFVKRSVHEIVRILTAVEKEEDPTLLIDFFSVPAHPSEEVNRTKQKNPQTPKGTGPTPPPPPPPPPRPQNFRIQRISGGFSILPGPARPPAKLDVRVAYDIRRGSPLGKYNTADFRLDRDPIRLEPAPDGMDVLYRAENRLIVRIQRPDFSLHVVGFDQRRQIYVRATALEDADGGSQD